MKHFVTALFSLIFVASIVGTSSAQIAQKRSVTNGSSQTIVAKPAGLLTPSTLAENFSKSGGFSPLAGLQVDTVSYFTDTTGGNWWLRYPLFDSIGPIQIGLGAGHDTTAFDTMYYRVLALRVSTPTDFLPGKTRYLDSASISVYVQSMSPKDFLQFWVVPMEDVQFTRQGTPIGTYPIPDLFANTATPPGTDYAKGTITAGSLTVGALNTATVKFGHVSLGVTTKTQFGIVVFVDGPDFATDTIGYQMDANLAPTQGANLVIDTDGTINGTIMRTYEGNLDGGHLLLGGSTRPSLVGGISSFFTDIPQADAMGNATGQSFNGNLVLKTYFSGQPGSNGVNARSQNEYNLSAIYPNPVTNASAEIGYSLGNSGAVSLKVYNALGQEVSTLVNRVQTAGQHSVTLNASALPTGLYFYTLKAGAFAKTMRMVVTR